MSGLRKQDSMFWAKSTFLASNHSNSMSYILVSLIFATSVFRSWERKKKKKIGIQEKKRIRERKCIQADPEKHIGKKMNKERFL